MAGFFKKRRKNNGPSKNEEKVMRGERADAEKRMAGTLSSRFPGVKRLKVDAAFIDPRGVELDRKTISLGSNDPVALAFDCPGRCGRGSLVLSAAIEGGLQARRPVFETSVKCAEQMYAGEVCGTEARCRAEVEYLPAEDSAPAA